MKTWITFSFLCCFASLFSVNKEDRIYIAGDQIAIHDKQLLVCIENQWVATNAIFSDTDGVYVLGRRWYEPWECSYCGAVNPPHRLVCWSCSK